MLLPRPPRREPRLLALRASRKSLAWAAIDPWELRGLGRLPVAPAGFVALALVRLLLRVRPSAIALLGPASRATSLIPTLRAVARRRSVPLVVPTRAEGRAIRAARLPHGLLRAELPELATVRDRALLRTAALALAALSILKPPRRPYVVSGLVSRATSPVGARGPRRTRPA